MARDWRLVVRCASPSIADDVVGRVGWQFDLEHEEESDVVVLYGDAPMPPEAAEAKLLQVLDEDFGMAEDILRPIGVERWDEKRGLYVEPQAPGWAYGDWENAEVRPDEVTWAVEIVPADVWHPWQVFDEIVARGRPPVRRDGHGGAVGARDEADARALAAELDARADVRRATPRKLSWLSRWWLRERLLGNYAGYN